MKYSLKYLDQVLEVLRANNAQQCGMPLSDLLQAVGGSPIIVHAIIRDLTIKGIVHKETDYIVPGQDRGKARIWLRNPDAKQQALDYLKLYSAGVLSQSEQWAFHDVMVRFLLGYQSRDGGWEQRYYGLPVEEVERLFLELAYERQVTLEQIKISPLGQQ